MAIEFKDYYATLGVARDASAEAIKQAFRKLARQYHPDVAKDKKTAEAKFKEINEANEVLSDPEKRKKYDQLDPGGPEVGEGQGFAADSGAARDGRASEFHFGGTGFSDFFEQFFSGGNRYGFPGQTGDSAQGPGADRGARRGGDIEGDILVTLEEAMHGTQRPISLRTMDRRTGAVEEHAFEVRIPPGAIDGRRIRVPGQGEPGASGGAAGDLYLRVRHAAHPDLHAREADLYRELDVAPWETVLGAEIVVPTLDGSIRLKIPAGTQSGQTLRVRGRGLPRDRSGARGDFYVVVTVQVPTDATAEERALWEKLRDLSRFHPRRPDSSPS